MHFGYIIYIEDSQLVGTVYFNVLKLVKMIIVLLAPKLEMSARHISWAVDQEVCCRAPEFKGRKEVEASHSLRGRQVCK